MSNAKVEKMATELVMPIIDELSFELFDVQYVKEGSSWCLKIFIDKEGGISIDDCEAVSRRFGKVLDEKDPIQDSYFLEVSSPGIDRPLKKETDFIKYKGSQVEVKLYKARVTKAEPNLPNPKKGGSRSTDAKQKEFTGQLTDFDDATVTISTEEGELIVFERKDIALVKLSVTI